MRLAEFPNASDQDYRHLQRDIDALPPQRVLLFDNCVLPSGCVPAQATLGLYKDNVHYAVYLDRNIRYSGNNHAMVALSGGVAHSFRSFGEMKRFLKALPSETAAHETGSEPATETAEEYILEDIVSVEGLTTPQREAQTVPDYKTIQHEMEKHIIGQSTAVETIAHQTSLHLNKTKPRRPLSIIAYGPPGTGKSEAAKALSKILSQLCTQNYATVWTELNTFTEAHSVYRLTGSPPGYVGYDDTPVFEAVASNAYTIFIFDELDKAHPEVLKTFMSILDEGRCASRKELPNGSREYDFRRCIFIFTSNFRLGSASKSKAGFAIIDEIEDIQHDAAVDVSYRETMPNSDEAITLTQRIYCDTEAARKAFVEAGVLREIASRFNCFVEFQELNDEAKIRILAQKVIETGFEYDIRLTHISSEILQALVDASMSGEALTVRSFKSVIDGYLAATFAKTGANHAGQAVRLEGTIENPKIVPS